jgi:D-3-phosphoglycerate dehydrogenase / 2-oxoglutarate reductase
MRIVISDDYQNAVPTLACFTRLAGHDVAVFNDSVTGDALVERYRDADAIVMIRERTEIDATLLDRLPSLKLISQTGKGTTHIDVDACTARGIAVAAGTGSPVAPAELTFALILAAMRHIPREDANLRAGGWQTTLGRVLRGRTLGIYGYGKIGSMVAGFGRAFGMNLLAFGQQGSAERAQREQVAVAPDKATLFTDADVLSLHLRLTPQTTGIVTPADLALMKDDALLVNTSRAELIEPNALVEALRRGRPGFAAVDVYEEEPVRGASNPLLQLPNVVATPHLGYVEKDSYELYFGQAFDQVVAFAQGQPINVVNPEALTVR